MSIDDVIRAIGSVVEPTISLAYEFFFVSKPKPVHSLIRSCGIVRITGASEKMEIQ
jgi:hypothetical protein